MSEEIKEILDDYKKLAGEITEKLDNTAEYESWLIIQDYIDEFLNYITNLQKENKDYKQRNEKAVEYIRENEQEYGSLLDNEKIILNILKGDDE